MKAVLLLCLAGVALASPKPGGYIAKGGVFDFKRPLDYLDAGKAAGKFAWNKKFQDELSGKSKKNIYSRGSSLKYLQTVSN